MSESDDSSRCVVCCQTIPNANKKSIYAIGSCGHSVCYECSTRMRVLCNKNECPICRQELSQVLFTRNRNLKFESFDLSKAIYHNNYGIHFEDEECLDSYGRLLEHPCRKCKHRKPFKSVHDLLTHLRKEHELHLCDLCVGSLRVFSSELKYYTRKDLVRHRKSGDPDETSHRGHPICHFCDVRYVDDDELQTHLRREHYYCHFCDPSGLSHFYGEYNALRDHFLSDHYLCKECDSLEEKFTNAFRSEIDLIAHIAQIHSQNMTKSDLKKAKTLSLDTFIRQRSGHLNEQQHRGKKERRTRSNNAYSHYEVEPEHNSSNEESNNSTASAQPPRPEDFPQLCGSNANNEVNNTNDSNDNKPNEKTGKSKKQSTFSVCVNKNPKLNTRNDDDFPALPGFTSKNPIINTSNTLSYNKSANQSIKNYNNMKSQSNSQSSNQMNSKISSVAANFNVNNQMESQKQTNKPINKPMINSSEEFPSLPITKKKSGAKSLNKNTELSRNSMALNASNSVNDRNKKDITSDWIHSSNVQNGVIYNSNESKTLKMIPQSNSADFPSLQSNKKIQPKPPILDDFPALEVKKNKTKGHYSQAPKRLIPNNGPPGLPSVRKKSSNLSLSSVAQEVISNPSVDAIDDNMNEFCYINPIDFTDRNRKLVKQVEQVLNDYSKFCTFRDVSKQFRQELINGDQYYKNCIELFGKNNFGTIFSELLVLLPDIRKQNELLIAQQNDYKNSRGAIPKGSTFLNDNSFDEFIVCKHCKQVLNKTDSQPHMVSH